MALGATGRDVLALVLRRGLTLLLAGVVAGTLAAFALTRLMAGLLFAVSPADPATFASIVLFLGAVTVLACYIPALRATKVDPIVALRHE
jgi:ABC-type antimicrobial peptide transport system permease subunit